MLIAVECRDASWCTAWDKQWWGLASYWILMNCKIVCVIWDILFCNMLNFTLLWDPIYFSPSQDGTMEEVLWYNRSVSVPEISSLGHKVASKSKGPCPKRPVLGTKCSQTARPYPKRPVLGTSCSKKVRSYPKRPVLGTKVVKLSGRTPKDGFQARKSNLESIYSIEFLRNGLFINKLHPQS